MTGSAWVDLIVIGLALLAGISGFRQGAVASALAFFGVVLGAVAGIMLAPHLMTRFDEREVRLLVGILILLLLVIVGEVAGMVLGRAARSGIRSPGVRRVDSVVGSVLQVVAVLVAAWLLAIPLSNAGSSFSTAVRESRVLGAVDDVAPQWLRDLPNEFSALLDTSGLPQVIGPFGRTPAAPVEPPDPALQELPVVTTAHASVVKVNGVAPSCRQELEGTGFVVSPERVMTNAHVVAGTRRISVETSTGEVLTARPVLFDAENDVAVLDVPGLSARALEFSAAPGRSGDDAIVLGHPGGGPYTASAVRIRDMINLSGPDIYRTGQVLREVYTVRGQIRQGNSGGPMIAPDGAVLGVVFGAAEDEADETGFVMTAAQVQANLEASENRAARVSTQTCVSPA